MKLFQCLYICCLVFQFFNYVSYFIGGEVFTLQDIENGVLRGNRKGVAQIMKPFSRNDPRLQVSQEEDERFVQYKLIPLNIINVAVFLVGKLLTVCQGSKVNSDFVLPVIYAINVLNFFHNSTIFSDLLKQVSRCIWKYLVLLY